MTTGLHVHEALFLGGAATMHNLPPSRHPEIAVVGRSNVGKSSFINRISQRKQLARTSATPGRTQELNFFELRFKLIEKDAESLHEVTLVDLPGYGFARVSKQKREDLSRLTVDFLDQRDEPRVVCILNDCRRDPEDDERAVQRLAFNAGREVLVVLTKADKLKRNELSRRISEVSRMYGLEEADVVVTGEGIPVVPFWQRVTGLLAL